MGIKHWFSLILSILFIGCNFLESAPYTRPEETSVEIWERIQPYLLPENSHEKELLDRIFSKRRVLRSLKNICKSGFDFISDPEKHIIVASHPEMPGYLMKTYLDHHDVDELYWWERRIIGAIQLKESIRDHHYTHLFKVPKKWIYCLPPESPQPSQGKNKRHYVLIVENMQALSKEENRKAYRKKITKKHLDGLYVMIMKNGLVDSVYLGNIPFCEDGKIAFLDTEHVARTDKPIPITNMAQYLSSSMYKYWEQLIVHGGPW